MSSSVTGVNRHLAIVNPAAGNGRCGKRAPAALARLRQAGLRVEVRESTSPGDATRVARDGFQEGHRRFVAAGGDGTTFEVLNGILPESLARGERVRLGFLPFGTGNAYLRDFSAQATEHAIESLITGRRRVSDVLKLEHAGGRTFFVNLCGFGLAAEVVRCTQGGLKRFGVFGYTVGVLLSLVRLRYSRLPMRIDGGELDDAALTFACVCNSRYTADMLIAPQADVGDGRADLIRVAPMGRLALLRAFPRIFRGRHIDLPAVSSVKAETIRFELEEERELMIDGEVLRLVPRRISVLPQILEVCV